MRCDETTLQRSLTHSVLSRNKAWTRLQQRQNRMSLTFCWPWDVVWWGTLENKTSCVTHILLAIGSDIIRLPSNYCSHTVGDRNEVRWDYHLQRMNEYHSHPFVIQAGILVTGGIAHSLLHYRCVRPQGQRLFQVTHFLLVMYMMGWDFQTEGNALTLTPCWLYI